MSALHYEIWSQTAEKGNGGNGRLVDLVASGTIPLSPTNSAAILIPKGGRPSTDANSLAGIFKVLQASQGGTDRAYVEIRADGSSSTQGQSNASTDVVPRSLVGSDDGAVLFNLPPGGAFTAVLAAAVS